MRFAMRFARHSRGTRRTVPASLSSLVVFASAFALALAAFPFGVHAQRTLDRLALFWRCGQIVVQSDRFNPNRSTYADNPPIHGGRELAAVEGNLAP